MRSRHSRILHTASQQPFLGGAGKLPEHSEPPAPGPQQKAFKHSTHSSRAPWLLQDASRGLQDAFQAAPARTWAMSHPRRRLDIQNTFRRQQKHGNALCAHMKGALEDCVGSRSLPAAPASSEFVPQLSPAAPLPSLAPPAPTPSARGGRPARCLGTARPGLFLLFPNCPRPFQLCSNLRCCVSVCAPAEAPALHGHSVRAAPCKNEDRCVRCLILGSRCVAKTTEACGVRAISLG